MLSKTVAFNTSTRFIEQAGYKLNEISYANTICYMSFIIVVKFLVMLKEH